MGILGKNAPAFDYRLVGVRAPDGEVQVRLQVVTASGDLYTLQRWTGPHGRLDAGQLLDCQATVSEELAQAVIQAWGVQTVLR